MGRTNSQQNEGTTSSMRKYFRSSGSGASAPPGKEDATDPGNTLFLQLKLA